MRWTVAEIAAEVDGTISAGDPSIEIRSVTQDSRDVGPGALFVPLVADRDGHDFIAAAVAAGAVATLTARPSHDVAATDIAVIEVADTELALGALGRAGRARFEGRAEVFGITGSVGKTTTKDLLAAVMATDRPTHASHRSFNNEIGVPLTILSAPDDTRALVLELGSRGVGHIAALCELARPTVGIVTRVGLAHTSEFGSVEVVARAKGELVEALPAEGLAVLNAADPRVMAMAERTGAQVVTFGAGGDVIAEEVMLDDELVPRFRLASHWGSTHVELGARGVHLVDNALAAAAAALPLGLSTDQVAAGLATAVMSPLRMALERTPGGTRILNDAYNANPMSTEAALRSLVALPASNRIAVLGVMAELGEESEAEHARIGRLASELGIEIIAVAAPEYVAAASGGSDVADIDEAATALASAHLGVDDAVLVKGSRVAGLEQLVERLTG